MNGAELHFDSGVVVTITAPHDSPARARSLHAIDMLSVVLVLAFGTIKSAALLDSQHSTERKN